MADLHVWALDDCEWVIASGREDALELLGVTREEWDDDALVEMPDDAGLGISIDDATGDVANFDEPAPSHVEHHTCREWVERFGHCYLATTEH